MGNTEFNKVIKSYLLWGFSEPLKCSHTTDHSPQNSFVHRVPHRTHGTYFEKHHSGQLRSHGTHFEKHHSGQLGSHRTHFEKHCSCQLTPKQHMKHPQETEKDEQGVLVKILTTCSPKREKNSSSGVCPFPWCEHFHHGLLEATSMTSMNTDLGREHTLNARTLYSHLGSTSEFPAGRVVGRKKAAFTKPFPSTPSDFSCDQQTIIKHKQK